MSWPICPISFHRANAPLGSHDYWPELHIGDRVSWLGPHRQRVEATVAAIDKPDYERVWVWLAGKQYATDTPIDQVNRHAVRVEHCVLGKVA